MNLQHRIDLLVRLGEYLSGNNETWQETKEKATRENGWFIPEFVESAAYNIKQNFLQRQQLENWTSTYNLPAENKNAKNIGIVMAGNIPMVGFHDLLSVFISGHNAIIKLSSKDSVLIKHCVEKLTEWAPSLNNAIQFADNLKNCDAYIATGSNNSSRYFEYYFGKYPNIIRKNRTSVAILSGEETQVELEKLADDVYSYFGLGCRNVTKLYVPQDYNFVPLLEAFRKYNHLADHHKYKNNYDYNLALHLLNKKYYMTNGSILLIEDSKLFSPVSQLNYEFYSDKRNIADSLKNNPELQCIVGKGYIPFGQSQCPAINEYADGIDTLSFLTRL